MALVGKHYYVSPLYRKTIGGQLVYRPLLDDAVDQNGGAWAIVYQDSDVIPRWQVVAVNDRTDPSLPHNPQVHVAIGQQSGTHYLSDAFALARAVVAQLYGAAHANSRRFLDQTVGGESPTSPH